MKKNYSTLSHRAHADAKVRKQKAFIFCLCTRVFEKNSKEREFSSSRASRGVTTAPIALVREYIFKLLMRFPTTPRSSLSVQYRVAGGVRDFVHLQRKFHRK